MAATKSQAREHALAYVGLAALFVIAVTHFARDAFDRLDAMRHAHEYVREPFQLGDWNWGATDVQPEAEAAGMKFADAVLAVNGHPVDGFYSYYHALRQARAGDLLRVQSQVQYQGNTPIKDLSIPLRPYASTPGTTGRSAYVDFTLRGVLLPSICIGLGFWVAAVRIGDPSAWMLLVVLLSLAVFVGSGSGMQGLFGRETPLQPMYTAFRVLLSNTMAPALMLFGIVFPQRLALDRRFPFVKWVVLGYVATVTLLVSIAFALEGHHLALARDLKRPVELLTGVEGDFYAGVNLLGLVVGVAALGWKTYAASSPDARRRLLLLDWGAALSVAALLTIVVADRWVGRLPRWSSLPLMVMLLAFPVTMAYVIVVHKAMDVRVVVRQGLQYVLARGGIRAMQVVLLVAVSVAATSLLSGGAGFGQVAIVVAGMAAIVTSAGRFASRLRLWVDRRFFRDAYEADAILSDLASQVRTMVETGPLLETVATRIAASLHVPRIAILLDGGGGFQPAHALGYGSAPAVAIPSDGVTARRLRKQQHALVQFDAADSWVQVTMGAERRSLEELQPELLLPLSVNDKILGIMSLGPKQSEEPFSTTDIRLLDSVAAQTGLALENGRLTAAVAAEVAARAKQTRDIEIARTVQQRLFPQEYPPIPGLDYAGACRAALGVGGDYYDFILLTPTQLGIAIGDVSGKGVPAALLMATLRAYLRGAQTIHHQADLTEVMRNLNKLVFESSDANRYATFFYGELDLASRTLTYVNAGHNPPMLFRHADGGREALRLDTGGPVIGLMEECSYRQACVTLAVGDVLVAYTDGISEAMNAADEEWGEDRLMDAVRPNRAEAARTLIDRLMVSADAFVAGAPQHDDMTLLIVRAI
jgi:sigma-B regulation protein RsbU (phosphoserine phosphatase)